ncbi:MAG: hypothetical protein R2753_08360 [Chitinophagales bacterium]
MVATMLLFSCSKEDVLIENQIDSSYLTNELKSKLEIIADVTFELAKDAGVKTFVKEAI